jgi:hypothetical protein
MVRIHIFLAVVGAAATSWAAGTTSQLESAEDVQQIMMCLSSVDPVARCVAEGYNETLKLAWTQLDSATLPPPFFDPKINCDIQLKSTDAAAFWLRYCGCLVSPACLPRCSCLVPQPLFFLFMMLPPAHLPALSLPFIPAALKIDPWTT